MSAEQERHPATERAWAWLAGATLPVEKRARITYLLHELDAELFILDNANPSSED